MQGVMKGVLFTLLFAVIIALVVIYGGLADVAASHPHSAITRWAFNTAMERAVERNASSVVAPNPLPQPSAGFHEFNEMCATCHGAPGKRQSELAAGMRPSPPDLSKAAREWSDAELFWIIKNGVKMTGMPAWSATHSDQELWEIVGMVRALPGMTPEQYAKLEQESSASPGPSSSARH